MFYTNRFENDPELSTAPAQVVSIRQTLDTDLDPRTFRLGSFGFGEYVFNVPENTSYYSDRLDLTDSLGIYVDVSAGTDINTNEVFWILRSTDPATGQAPTDPFAGFLPVNDPETHIGEGFVNYTIRAKETAVTGDVIDAQARIVFDVNDPIDTPPIFNTIDADLAASLSQSRLGPAGRRGRDSHPGWLGLIPARRQDRILPMETDGRHACDVVRCNGCIPDFYRPGCGLQCGISRVSADCH